jgi:hypothetical protein
LTRPPASAKDHHRLPAGRSGQQKPLPAGLLKLRDAFVTDRTWLALITMARLTIRNIDAAVKERLPVRLRRCWELVLSTPHNPDDIPLEAPLVSVRKRRDRPLSSQAAALAHADSAHFACRPGHAFAVGLVQRRNHGTE